MTVQTSPQETMHRGQLWIGPGGHTYVIVSDDAITQETGNVLAIRLVPGEYLPLHSAFITHLSNGLAALGTNLVVLFPPSFTEPVEGGSSVVTDSELDDLDAMLRAVMGL